MLCASMNRSPLPPGCSIGQTSSTSPLRAAPHVSADSAGLGLSGTCAFACQWGKDPAVPSKHKAGAAHQPQLLWCELPLGGLTLQKAGPQAVSGSDGGGAPAAQGACRRTDTGSGSWAPPRKANTSETAASRLIRRLWAMAAAEGGLVPRDPAGGMCSTTGSGGYQQRAPI